MQRWTRLSTEDKTKRINLQDALETDLLEYSVSKYWRGIEHDAISGPAEQDLIHQFIGSLTFEFKKAQDLMASDARMRAWLHVFLSVPPEIVAGLTVTQIVEDLVDSRDIRKKIHTNGVDNFYSVAYRLGRECKLVAGFRYAKDQHKDEFKHVNRYTKNWDDKKIKRWNKKMQEIPKWSKKQTLYLGICLLNVAKASGLVNVEQKIFNKGGGRRHRYNQISINPDVMLELIRKHDQYQFLRLVYRPMLIPPIPHTADEPGGCRAFDRRKPTVGGISRGSDQSLQTINTLQATEWSINTQVLEVMETLYKRSDAACNLPAYDFTEFTFTRPWPEEGTGEEKHAWKRDKEEQYSKWYKEVQKRAQMEIRLQLARKMTTLKFFYHAWTQDFRGRYYTVTEMLSSQSGDFDRGLIQFANPEVVTTEGMYWLMVHTANCFDGVDFGNGPASDKDTFDDRVRWVKSNINYLRKISEDPYGNSLWMDNETTKKNTSFQRLAAAFGFIEALDTGLSSLPVQLDGSCNGSQHWSAIMRDQKIAELVNVTSTDKPGDLYQYVADIATDIVSKGQSTWHQIFYEHWEGNIPRKVLKRSTMCDAYGITDHGIRRYVREEGHIKWVEDNVGRVRAQNELATVIRNALDGAMESSNWGKEYLQNMCRLCSAANRHASWVTPNGFRVVNRYTVADPKIMHTQFYLKNQLTIRYTRDTDDPNADFAAQAIPPNFIHSLDAAHMSLVVNHMSDQGVTSFSMIHDSFGCHCNRVPLMRQVINETFYEIHKKDQLEVFHGYIEDVLKQPVATQLPKRGDLDIEGVLGSDYLFG